MEEHHWAAVAGAIGATVGVAGKSLQVWLSDRASRDLSQRDLWARLKTMDRRLDVVSQSLERSRNDCAELRVLITRLQAENEQLRGDMADLQVRYDRLSQEHRALQEEQARRSHG